ncbi:MAG: phosphodiester glycosidase family protein [Parvularculaceae bacterium]
MLRRLSVALILLSAVVAPAVAGENHCSMMNSNGADYAVCRFDPKTDDIRLFLGDAGSSPYGHFFKLEKALNEKGEKLTFAMNAGMYRKDRAPVGLYVERGEEKKAINTNNGPGNFHLKPNGVFWIDGARGAGVTESGVFDTSRPDVAYATQSGPMLVIDGALHPRFLPDSDSLKRRNGVGVTAAGEIVFVLSDSPVRFYDFARFFRDELKTPNALYLDGTISRIFAPELQRNDPGAEMGPIIGVVEKHD